MADSIRRRIVDACMTRLGGDASEPQPAGLGLVKFTKNRKTAIARTDLPLYAVYFISESPKTVGDPRRPVLMQRTLTMAVRIVTNGNDDDADGHAQWVIHRMATADRLPQPDGTTLTLSIVEGETIFESLEGSEEERTVTTIHWLVEYQTPPADITRTK